ncbi:MAG: hypothetical protein R6U22_11045 [Desulfohalobiaceae bacterium]
MRGAKDQVVDSLVSLFIESQFQVQLHLTITPRYNIPPGEEILAIGQAEDGLHKAAWLHWGLVPHWLSA